MLTTDHKQDIVVMGGGLAGLSAGYSLTKAGKSLTVLESDTTVGGLSRTIRHGDFKFDLGGHRFFTQNKETNQFVKDILQGDYLSVQRKSKIFMKGRFFDYPLKPSNALFGLGLPTTVKALSDYGKEKIRGLFSNPVNISLEDWVTSHFGRTMFLLYFKEYSEKVWGIECEKISQDWVAKRIEGLSLGVAIKNAFFNQGSKNIKTLADTFIYPSHGIGQISDRLMEEIDKENSVLTSTGVSRIHHNNHKITGIDAVNCDRTHAITGNEFVSSIPITHLVSLLNPAPPAEVLHAVSKLRYRDVIIASVMLNRERVTDLTWMYLPEKSMELGRIHEPRNWSPHMAPEGKTHIVAEYFCFQGDRTWNSTDEELTEATVKQLERLGFVQKHDVIDSCVVRVPRAYPLFEVGYSNHYSRILDYLEQFTNLHVAGRTGMFKYYNMDRAIESGIEVAENILKRNQASTKTLLAGV